MLTKRKKKNPPKRNFNSSNVSRSSLSALSSGRPVSVLGECVSEAIIAEREIRNQVLLRHGCLVEVEKLHQSRRSNKKNNKKKNEAQQQQQDNDDDDDEWEDDNDFNNEQLQNVSEADRAAYKKQLREQFEHEKKIKIQQQSILDSLTHAICFVPSTTAESLKSPPAYLRESRHSLLFKSYFDDKSRKWNRLQPISERQKEDQLLLSTKSIVIGRILTSMLPAPLKALKASELTQQTQQQQQSELETTAQ